LPGRGVQVRDGDGGTLASEEEGGGASDAGGASGD